MSWKEVSIVSQRKQFYDLWQQGRINMTELCKLFGVSRKTGYKWISRAKTGDVDCFDDLSSRPYFSPGKTPASVEQVVLGLRKIFPDWGGRKLKKRLETTGEKLIPSASTITEILRRNGLLENQYVSGKQWVRFEHESPNDLWQMDFKGHFQLLKGRCHPLTVLDDHSRFNLVLKACAQETRQVVKPALIEAFERYGLPERMTMDNGSPWGHKAKGYTKLTVWLMDVGIQVSHSRPYHPQTQGKDERFHRTLKKEVLSRQTFSHLQACQKEFDRWSEIYNFVRPHDALNLEVPATRYRVSKRFYQGENNEYSYLDDDILRKVNRSGTISYKNQKCFLGEAFAGRPVAIKRTINPHEFEVYYRYQRIAKINITQKKIIN